MASSGAQPSSKTFAHEVHYFSQNPPALQSSLKATIGHLFPISKYDVPHYNPTAPLGTSVFQLNREADFAISNSALLNQKYADNMVNMRRKKTKKEKHPEVVAEPRPGPNHVICAICREQFKDYLEHIAGERHKVGVRTNMHIYGSIDRVIDELLQSKRGTISTQEALTASTEDQSSGASKGGTGEMCDPGTLAKKRLHKMDRK